jgi:glycosyltransferase involved in cell wall biosynthesis
LHTPGESAETVETPMAGPVAVASPAPTVSFLIPVYNEAATIRQVLEAVTALPLDLEVVVVDDGSRDGTSDILASWQTEHPATVVVAQPNLGKGAALRAAIARARGDIVVVQDADLEYDPAHIPALIDPIVRGEAEVVYGSRFAAGVADPTWQLPNRLGNRALSLLTSIIYRHRVRDMETGQKVMRREAIESLHLRENDFAVEPEITAKILKRGLRLVELPVSYHPRSHAEGKKIRWRDAAKAIRTLIVERFRD